MRLHEVDRDEALIEYLNQGPSMTFDPQANWELFAEWAVHYNGGSGEIVEKLSGLSGRDLTAEDFDDEVENIMQLKPMIYLKLAVEYRTQFEQEVANEVRADTEASSTRGAFRLLSDHKLPSDTLLVHFTNNAQEILAHGFRHGVRDINHLGETVRLPSWMKQQPGYNFAYLASQSSFGLQKGAWKRTHAILFRHTGVYVRHFGDREEQVIFWGPYVPRSAIVKAVRADELP